MNLAEAFAINDKIAFGLSPDREGDRVKLLVKKTKKDLLAVVISNRDKERVSLDLNDTLYVFSGDDDAPMISEATLVQNNAFPLIILKLLEEPRPAPTPEPEDVRFALADESEAPPIPTLPEEDRIELGIDPGPELVGEDEMETIALDELEEEGVVVAPLRQGEVLLDGVPELKDEELDLVIEESEPAPPAEPDDAPVLIIDEEPEIELQLSGDDEPELIVESKDEGLIIEAPPEEREDATVIAPPPEEIELELVDEEIDLDLTEGVPAIGAVEEIEEVEESETGPAIGLTIPKPPSDEVALRRPTPPSLMEEDAPDLSFSVEHDGMLIEEIDDHVAPLQPAVEGVADDAPLVEITEEEAPSAPLEETLMEDIPEPPPVTAASEETAPIAASSFFDFFPVTLSAATEGGEQLSAFALEEVAMGEENAIDPAVKELRQRVEKLEGLVAAALQGDTKGGSPLSSAIALSMTPSGMTLAADRKLEPGSTVSVTVDHPWNPPLRFTARGEVSSSETVNGVSVSRIRFSSLSGGGEEAITAYLARGAGYYALLKNLTELG